jgi:hypothetical protein
VRRNRKSGQIAGPAVDRRSRPSATSSALGAPSVSTGFGCHHADRSAEATQPSRPAGRHRGSRQGRSGDDRRRFSLPVSFPRNLPTFEVPVENDDFLPLEAFLDEVETELFEVAIIDSEDRPVTSWTVNPGPKTPTVRGRGSVTIAPSLSTGSTVSPVFDS